MLLANRRLAIIHLCLTGIETGWAAPLLLAFYGRATGWSLWQTWGTMWALLIICTLAIELLARSRVKSPRYELAVFGLIILSGLAFVRLLAYGGGSLRDLRWLGSLWNAVRHFGSGLNPALALLIANFWLWQRAASATSREVGFFSVGLSFRLNTLLLIVTGTLYGYMSGQAHVSFLWPFFGLGLTAVAVARVNERAAGARSMGTPLPARRLVQLLGMVALTVGLAALVSLVYTPTGVRDVLWALRPLWQIPLNALLWLLRALVWLAMPLLLWLEQQAMQINLQPIALALRELSEMLPRGVEREVAGSVFPAWVGTVLRDVGIAVALVLALGAIWLYLERQRQQREADEAEEEGAGRLSFGGDALRRGLQRARDLAALVRRLGVGRQLLAAISVENIYANLSRLARQRGHGRRPAQPPDDYLPVLERAFPGELEALSRITDAYMRVHYGERPVSDAELAALRSDYHHLRALARPGSARPARGGLRS